MKIQACCTFLLLAISAADAARARVYPLDLPLQSDCPSLVSLDFNGDGASELVSVHGSSGEISTLEMLHHRRLHRARPSYSEYRFGDMDVWSEGQPHFLVLGIRSNSSTNNIRILSVAGLDGEIVLERQVATANLPQRITLLDSRSPVDFDFAVSAPGELQAYRSTLAKPIWSTSVTGAATALGRADINGDGIDDLIVGSSPIGARDAVTGELIWTGTTNGATGFYWRNLGGDDAPELIAVGGNPTVAIYGGEPLTLTGAWSGNSIGTSAIHDADEDGVFELLVAEHQSGIRAIDLNGRVTRTLFPGRNVSCLAIHRFANDESEKLIATVSGYSQSDVLTVSTLGALSPNEPATHPLANGPFSRIELAEFTPGELSIAHSFIHPFGAGNSPVSSGVRVISTSTQEILYESAPWQRSLVDFAIGSPHDVGQARQLWLTGAAYHPFDNPWVQAIDGRDFAAQQGRSFPEFGRRPPHSLFVIPAEDDLDERLLLLTTGADSEDFDFLAHTIDPESLEIVGPAIELGIAGAASAQLINIDGVGRPELVTRTHAAISARSVPDGTLRWQVASETFGFAFAANTAHKPALFAHRQGSLLVLRKLLTAELIDSIEMPFEVEAIGGGDVDPDLFLLAAEGRLWEYSISARTLTPSSRSIGTSVGHHGNIRAAQVGQTPVLLMGSFSGMWTYGAPALTRVFYHSFEASISPKREPLQHEAQGYIGANEQFPEQAHVEMHPHD